ncbi:hypothetical protein ACOSP7_002792 [Xanthoceras sorbifolium]
MGSSQSSFGPWLMASSPPRERASGAVGHEVETVQVQSLLHESGLYEVEGLHGQRLTLGTGVSEPPSDSGLLVQGSSMHGDVLMHGDMLVHGVSEPLSDLGLLVQGSSVHGDVLVHGLHVGSLKGVLSDKHNVNYSKVQVGVGTSSGTGVASNKPNLGSCVYNPVAGFGHSAGMEMNKERGGLVMSCP